MPSKFETFFVESTKYIMYLSFTDYTRCLRAQGEPLIREWPKNDAINVEGNAKQSA